MTVTTRGQAKVTASQPKEATQTASTGPNIVYLNDDTERKASLERRAYEEAHPETVDWSTRLPRRTGTEFGGAKGISIIMIFSHFILWYFYLCLHINQGSLLYPSSPLALPSWIMEMCSLLYTHAFPTWQAWAMYWGFLVVQALFYVYLPGFDVKGVPIASLHGKKLDYHCSAISTWWATFGTFAVLHFTGIFPYTSIIDNLGPLTTVSIISSDFIGLAIHYNWFNTGKPEPNLPGPAIYDLFMGRVLNPRIGPIFDLKMWAEVRLSWILLFMLTSSSALKFYEMHGYLSNNFILLLASHFLYCYAIMKGEELIPPSFDIAFEMWGLMLIFWNLAGVPFLYCSQAIFLLRNDPEIVAINDTLFYVLLVLLFAAYYCWDTVNSQKNRFRQQYYGTYQPRPFAFPQLPWGTIHNPQYIRTKAGSPLLLSGWYGMARKFHYTSDIWMAFTWCISCGINTYFLPKFYFFFFVGMLIHRVLRDEEKCEIKYKEDWAEYTKRVPYRFIPYLF